MTQTNRIRFLGAFLVSMAWVAEFRAECNGQARYRWWVGDPLAAMNSFVASALDYIVGFFVLLASLSDALRSGLVATIEPLVIGQSALETKYPPISRERATGTSNSQVGSGMLVFLYW